MEIHYIKWRNIFCYGDKEEFIDLRDKEADLWQIIGKNGVGKSSMVKILKVALYRELEGVVVKQIANQINKRGYIEVALRSKGHDWRVEVEFSPNKLRVYKDNGETPVDWGQIDDTAKRIRTDVVDMPFYLFNNAISLSINDFKSFLKMSPKDARNIRDRIFSFTIINDMVNLMNVNMNKYIRDRDDVSKRIETINESIKTSETELEELKGKIEEENTEKVDKLKADKEKFEKELGDLEKEKNNLDGMLTKIKLGIDWCENETKKIQIAENEERLKTAEETAKNKELAYTGSNEFKDALVEGKQDLKTRNLLIKISGLRKEWQTAKDTSDKLTTEQTELSAEVTNLKTKIDEAGEYLAIEKDCELITVEATNISELQQKYRHGLEESKKLQKHKEDLDTKKTEGQAKIDESQKIVDDAEKKLKLFDEGKCPTCESNLSEQTDRRSEYEHDLESHNKKLEGYQKVMGQLETAIKNHKEKVDNHEQSLIPLQKQIADAYLPIVSLHDKLEPVKKIIKTSLDNTRNMEVGTLDLEEVQKQTKAILDGVNKPDTIEDDKKAYEEKSKKLEEVNTQLNEAKTSMSTKKSSFDTLKGQINGDIKEEAERIKKTKFVHSTEEEYDNHIKSSTEETKKKQEEWNTASTTVRDLQHEIKTAKESLLPDDHFKDLDTVALPKDITTDSITKYHDELQNKLVETQSELDEKSGHYNTKKEEVTRVGIQIDEMTKGDTFTKQLESVQNIINNFNKEIEEKSIDLEKYEKSINYYKMLNFILSDEGIKAYILQDIIPSINNEISKYMSMLGVPLQVVFDEEFKVHIVRFGEEVGLKTISTGQTKMIDCSILLAITKILKQKYASINVTFYDEVFSSIDSDNRVTLLEIFKAVCCGQLGMHTFIINHSYMPSSYFGYILPITYAKNFSSMEVLSPDDYEMRLERGDFQSNDTEFEEVDFNETLEETNA